MICRFPARKVIGGLWPVMPLFRLPSSQGHKRNQGRGLPARRAAFMAAASSLVAKRPLMRGRTSAYARRASYRIVFSNVRRLRFSRYLHGVSADICACSNMLKRLRADLSRHILQSSPVVLFRTRDAVPGMKANHQAQRTHRCTRCCRVIVSDDICMGDDHCVAEAIDGTDCTLATPSCRMPRRLPPPERMLRIPVGTFRSVSISSHIALLQHLLSRLHRKKPMQCQVKMRTNSKGIAHSNASTACGCAELSTCFPGSS